MREPFVDPLNTLRDQLAAERSINAELVHVLTAASHALKSYAHGNSAPDLAAGIAAKCDEALARAERRAR